MKADERNARAMALLFLQEMRQRAGALAQRLDPKYRRDYDRDPVLRALDAAALAAKAAIHVARATKLPGHNLLGEDTR